MKPLRRRPTDTPDEAVTDTVTIAGGVGVKGRPTPKRRDSQPTRGPVKAPKTRKEAMQRQKQLAKQGRTASAAAPKMSQAEYRAALKRGDASVLPRKDQGPVRALARDYVDSHRMLSNYLLLLFPLLVLSYIVPLANYLVIALLIVIVGETYFVGRRIRALAVNRGLKVTQGPLPMGFYATTRAYMPRRWRMPAPLVGYGDQI